MSGLFKNFLTVFFTVLVFSATLIAQESDTEKWNKAQEEMKAMFGGVPVMFTKLPLHVRANAWESFKAMNSPDAKIPEYLPQTLISCVVLICGLLRQLQLMKHLP